MFSLSLNDTQLPESNALLHKHFSVGLPLSTPSLSQQLIAKNTCSPGGPLKEPTNLVCKWDDGASKVVLEVSEGGTRRLRDSQISTLRLLGTDGIFKLYTFHFSKEETCSLHI